MLVVKKLAKTMKEGKIDLSRFSYKRRSLYDSAPLKLRSASIEAAARECGKSWPFLSASLYREFTRSGDREQYQKPYFEKRRRLGTLVTAAALKGDGSYINDIEEGIWSLISEPSWVLPAHNSYIRDTLQFPLPDTSRPILDLFACESGEILSLSLIVLDDLIDENLANSVRKELRERILKPYLTDHFWWMGDRGLNNWSPWCTQNVLISTASLDLDEKTNSKVRCQAAKTLDEWLSQYGEDGCCNEGASYWHAAGLCYSSCLRILGATELFKEEKVKALASYIENVHVDDDIYLNFSDCSPKAGRLGVREFLFAEATGNKAMMAHAARDFRKCQREADNDYNLYYRLLALEEGGRILEYKERSKSGKPPFVFYPSTGLAIYRDGSLTLAVKAGGNDEAHNHNDTGSITLYKGKKALLLDIGVETYTRTTFSKERYTLLPMQSNYHNVVNFPPFAQVAGAEYKAKDVRADERGIRMDLSKTFPKEAEVEMLTRSVSAPCNGMIMIKEKAKAKNPPLLTLMTLDLPQIDGSRLLFPEFIIHLDREHDVRTEEFPVNDKRLRKAWPPMLYRVLIPFDEELEWTIETRSVKK